MNDGAIRVRGLEAIGERELRGLCEVLVDCGPATTFETLVEALGDRVPRALLLTPGCLVAACGPAGIYQWRL